MKNNNNNNKMKIEKFIKKLRKFDDELTKNSASIILSDFYKYKYKSVCV